MEWQPASVKPKMQLTQYGFKETICPILVWIDDPWYKGAAMGGGVEYSDGTWVLRAHAHSGAWRVTHWCEVKPPIDGTTTDGQPALAPSTNNEVVDK